MSKNTKQIVVSSHTGDDYMGYADYQKFTSAQIKSIAKATKVIYDMCEDAATISAMLRVWLMEYLAKGIDIGLDSWVSVYIDWCTCENPETQKEFEEVAKKLEDELLGCKSDEDDD